MALRHPRAYHPTFRFELAIFYHQMLYCPIKQTLLQAIQDGAFIIWPGLTEKLISKYLSKSETMTKGHLGQQKQQPAAAVAVNMTHLATKAGKNTSELLLQIFDPTGKFHSDLTGKFSM